MSATIKRRIESDPQADASGFTQAAPSQAAAPRPANDAQPVQRGKGRRFALIASLPLLLALVGGYFWLTGGRYVSTDDAYVQQNRVTIVPEVAGRIVEVGAEENQPVHAGDLLFRIDGASYEVALQKAEAAVATARLDVERLKAAYAKALSDRQVAGQSLTFAQDNFTRQETLAGRGIVATATLDQARLDLHQAEAGVATADQAVLAANADLAGNPDIPVDDHPTVRQALSSLHQAQLDLEHTRVTAPSDGLVSQTDRLQVGQYVAPGASVVSLVETGRSWIEANFKETELTNLRPGQKVDVEVDTYPGHDLHGHVDSLGAGTGAEFSLLPAQNATGNWVKVVQRIPVRIALDGGDDLPALRTGMSANVSVDTGRRGFSAVAAEPAAGDTGATAQD